MSTQTTNQHALPNDVFHQAIQTFKAFQKDPANLPERDEYGTKYPGNITHEHYIFYALLRNKDPDATSHDPNSSDYRYRLEQIIGIGASFSRPSFLSKRLKEAFGLSFEELRAVLHPHHQASLPRP